jgi:tetratricopeptide (TPR) repeat protein
LEITGEWEEATERARQALQLASAHHNRLFEAKSLQMLGALYRMQGDFSESLKHLRAAQAIFEEIDHAEGLCDVASIMGTVYWNQGDLHVALRLLTQSKNIAQEISSHYRTYRAASNIGLVYWYQERHGDALQSFNEAREIARAMVFGPVIYTTNGIPAPIQHGGVQAVLNHDNDIEQMRSAYERRRDILYQGLSAIPGLRPIKPYGAFYMFVQAAPELGRGMDLVRRFLDAGVAVAPGSAFGAGFDDWVRFSLANADSEVQEAVQMLKAAFGR